MTRHRIPCALLALPLLVAAAPARAGNCRISSVASVAFTYDVFSTARQEGRGTITYDCSPPVSPTLTLSAGDSGTVAQRFMLLQGAGADQLLYNVYLDAACTQLWGTQALPGVGLSGIKLTCTSWPSTLCKSLPSRSARQDWSLTSRISAYSTETRRPVMSA